MGLLGHLRNNTQDKNLVNNNDSRVFLPRDTLSNYGGYFKI